MSKIEDLKQDILAAEKELAAVKSASDYAAGQAYLYNNKFRGLPGLARPVALEICRGAQDKLPELIEIAREHAICEFLSNSFSYAETILNTEVDQSAVRVRLAKNALENFENALKRYESMKKDFQDLHNKVVFYGANADENDVRARRAMRIKLTDLAKQTDQVKDCETFLAELETQEKPKAGVKK